MWVRVATFEGVDSEKAQRDHEAAMSSGEMTPPEGMDSVLVLDDKDAKKRKFLAFFDSKDAIEAAEPGFEQQGDTIPEEIRGKRTSVHYYEVVIYDGNVEDANAARVSVLQGSADAIDAESRKDTRRDTAEGTRDRRQRRSDRARRPRQRTRLDDHALGQRRLNAHKRAGGRPAA